MKFDTMHLDLPILNIRCMDVYAINNRFLDHVETIAYFISS
jgi:hypothetical protein